MLKRGVKSKVCFLEIQYNESRFLSRKCLRNIVDRSNTVIFSKERQSVTGVT